MEDKRASLAAEIITPERPQQHRKEALAHVDAPRGKSGAGMRSI
jgi:hypothetical protein